MNRLLQTLSLFSGIGGFELAMQMINESYGQEVLKLAQMCEIELFCQQVLTKNFPGVPIHDDVTTFVAEPGRFDLITGGFPCQDISCANPNGRGLEGERSGLFYELMRIVRTVRPRYVVLENVANLLNSNGGRDMGTVLYELSQSGFAAEWQIVSAASVGAPHLRERIFIVAHRNGQRCHDSGNNRKGRSIHDDINGQIATPSQEWGELQSIAGSVGEINADEWNGFTLPDESSEWESWNKPGGAKPSILRMDDGLSRGLVETLTTPPWNNPSPPPVAQDIPDRVPRIKALGNSVVPHCAAIALKRVLELEAQCFTKHPEPLHRKIR